MALTTIGGTGTLAAAGLATAGQYIQSALLDELSKPVGQSLILLLALIGVAMLFYRVALTGDYRTGLMLIFGAIMFSTAVYPRVVSNGVRWELGGREHDDQIVRETLRGVYDFAGTSLPGDPKDNPGLPQIRVSWVFAMWDRLTTGLVQVATQLIGVAKGKSDLKFLDRTSRYQQLFQMGVVDSDLQKFLQTILFDHCANYLSLYQSLVDPTQQDQAAQIQLQIDAIQDEIVISDTDRNYSFIQDLNNRGYFGTPPEDLPNLLSCHDLWSLAVTGVKSVAYSQTVQVVTDRLPDGMTPDEAIMQAAVKFGTDDTEDPTDIGRMINAISTRMIVGAFRDRYPALSAVNRLPAIRRPLENPGLGEEDRYDFSKNIQEQSQAAADGSQMQYLGYIMAMPYIQGILLYFLSLSYPVFALMLLVPQRNGSFLLWLGLWFWVKLWDFGFSAVMMLDDLLYFLLPHGPNLDDTQVMDPGAALRAVLSGDPTYTISIYWDIVVMLIVAIPIVTAMMVWVGGSAVMFEVRRAYSGFGDRQTSRQYGSRPQDALKDARNQRLARQSQMLPAATAILNGPANASVMNPADAGRKPGDPLTLPPVSIYQAALLDPAVVQIINSLTPQAPTDSGGTDADSASSAPAQIPAQPPGGAVNYTGGGLSDPSLRDST